MTYGSWKLANWFRKKFKYVRDPFPRFQIQVGISPPIWLSERSNFDKCDWFLRLGKDFSMHEANPNVPNRGSRVLLELLRLVCNDKLLYERSRLCKFLSLWNFSSCNESVNLLKDKERKFKCLSSNKDIGIDPFKLLLLKSSVSNWDQEAFENSASKPLNRLWESLIFCND